jgi:hypothetical protein
VPIRLGAAERFTEPTVPDDAGEREGFSITESGQAILGELGRSYGFKYDAGSWDWSLDNVAKAFEEHPVWTTFDYATLALPVAKWGLAAFRVSSAARGTSVAARALKAGQFVDEAPTKFGARVIGAFTSPQFGRAAELEHQYGHAQSTVGRFFSSRVAERATGDPEFSAMTAALGADPNDLRAINAMLLRERTMGLAAWEREAADVIRLQDKALGADPVRRQAFTDALTMGLDPGGFAPAATSKVGRFLGRGKRAGRTTEGFDPALASDQARAFHQQVGMDAFEAYQRTFDFRLKVHEGLYNAGFIGEEAYRAGLNKYFPRMYEELYGKASAARRGGPGVMGGAGRGLKARVLSEGQVRQLETEEVLTRILDPGLGVADMARSAMNLAGHNYFMRLANSAIAKTDDELFEHLTGVILNENVDDALVRAQRALYTPDQLSVMKTRLNVVLSSAIQADPAQKMGMVRKVLEEETGWHTLRYWMRGAPAKYLDRLGDDVLNKFIDPAVGPDLKALSKTMEDAEGIPGALSRTYFSALSIFKSGKTADNPATHVRQWIGNYLFHWLTVGGGGGASHGFYAAGRGAIEEINSGATKLSQDALDVLGVGQINSGHSRELVRDVQRAFGRGGKKPIANLSDLLTEIPMFGQTWIAKKGSAGLARAEHWYRYSDDVVKADALLIRRDAWLKSLAKEPKWAKASAEAIREEALGRAAQDVAKFQPMFSQASQFTELVRTAIPFASFTTEAARVWKNAIIEKPHIAFAANHLVESLSEVMGAMAGFTTDQLEAAQRSLPDYTAGKKMLMVPFRVNGKPAFMDFSYIIPMAQLGDAETADTSFFNVSGLDPFGNPALSALAVAATGMDPFTKREAEPRFVEQQLGVAVEGPRLRPAVGLAEHMARMMLPPLVPPGYAGVNLVEMMRGQRHPITGAELEQGVVKTVAANVAGLRLYQADTAAQLGNVKRTERVVDEEIGRWWERWQRAHVNGDAADMRESFTRIRALRSTQGYTPKQNRDYFAQAMKSREPGKFRTVTTRDLEATIQRTRQIPLEYQSPEDRRMLGELMARYQERQR